MGGDAGAGGAPRPALHICPPPPFCWLEIGAPAVPAFAMTAGRPDWKMFRLLGDCFLRAVIWKIYRRSPYFWATLSTLKVVY
jgi:hypothetical protein